jgi:hypothetical protein
MSSVYLVVLLVSNASGNVESIKAVDAVTQGGCTNLARQYRLSSDPTPAGYELKFACGTQEALNSAIAQHNCRAVEQASDANSKSRTYTCDPSLKNKFVSWMKSVF